MKFLKGHHLPAVRYLVPVVLGLLLKSAAYAGKSNSLTRSSLVQPSLPGHSIRKRDLAEVVVTDVASRGNKDHLRKVIFQRLFSLVDDSMGGKCSTKLNKESHQKSRDCNRMHLFGIIARKLKGGARKSGPNSEEIDGLIARLDNHSRRKLLHTVSSHMKRVRRKMMIQKLRRRRAYLRRLKRTRKLRENRRGAFDGKPIFWL